MTVVKIENLGKKYLLTHKRKEPYLAFRDVMSEPFRRVGKFLAGGTMTGAVTESCEEFWALQDVSFEISQGEKIGIIGRNGAGKSTLLKILSRIVEPTTGRIGIKGRVASLLEVGTGFHPELTGRENIYLNGAILGMSRFEIARNFDEIVDFAEVERFLDTPVKRFSSGMYVRLAFAVAAHLEPEILIVDEVLAVGDAQFQKKCLGKMEDVSKKDGKTIFFVSHNMQAIRQFCNRCILLKSGTVISDDNTDTVIKKYLDTTAIAGNDELPLLISKLPQDSVFKLEDIRILQNGEPVINKAENGQQLEIEMQYMLYERIIGFRIFFDLYDRDETFLFRTFHDDSYGKIESMGPGRYVSRGIIPANFLSPTSYEIRVLATIYDVRMCIPYPGLRIPIEVERTGVVNRAYLAEPIRGKLAPLIEWTTSIIE